MAEVAPEEAPGEAPGEAPEEAPEEAPDDGSSVALEEPATVAAVTLGQMLQIALGSARDGAIDFETLHNLLNALLIHLGLKDLLVQENGEPLEGAEESPFAFLKELKQRVEANEKEMAEFRTLCQELREEVTEMKEEQSRIAGDMQKIMDNIDVENFQNMLDDLRKQLLDSVLSALRDKDGGWNDNAHSWDDPGLIVIGNEITLLERTPIPRYRDTEPKTQDREKDLEANADSQPVSSRENGMGQIKGEDIKMSRSKRRSPTGGFIASGMHPGAPGTRSPVQGVQSAQGQPRSQTPGIPAKDGAETSKLPTSNEAGGRSSRMEAGGRSSRMEAGGRSSRMEAGGRSSRMEAGGRSSRMEPSPAEDGMMLLKVPSSEYSPCDQLVQLSGLHSEIVPSTPPPSPGLSGRLPHAQKKSPKQHREQDAAYHRGSPKYCGGRHTSTFARQPMESLLPDPNKPGVIELVGTDGLVYRGRTAPETDSPRDASPQK